MNPIDSRIEIRRLEVLMYGGRPLHPGIVYGREVAGYYDSVHGRALPTGAVPPTMSKELDGFAERYVITEDGKMKVERPAT